MTDTTREAVDQLGTWIADNASPTGIDLYNGAIKALLARAEAAEAALLATCQRETATMLRWESRLEAAEADRDQTSLACKIERRAKEEARAERDALAAKLALAVEALTEVDNQSSKAYRAKNGKTCSIEADNGEACEIVHSDAMFKLRATLAQLTADTPKEGKDDE